MRDSAMPMYVLLFGLVGWSMVSAKSNPQASCQPVSEETIAALFDRWNGALATLEPSRAAGQYHEDGVLIPPVATGIWQGRSEIEEYFHSFLRLRPQGNVQERTIRVGCNHATDSGLYTYTLQRDGKTSTVSSRFTFVYEYRDGSWQISAHHSSRIPEGDDAIAAN